MIPAFFLLGGLTAGLGIFAYAWKITAAEDTGRDWDAPIDYYPADHPGWRYLAEAINAERSTGFEQYADRELAQFECPLFDRDEVDRLRAIAAADAAGVQR